MRAIKRWAPAFVISAIIFCLSSLPGPAVDELGLGKESYHINGHFVLYFLLCFAFFKATKDIFVSIAFSVLYGIFDEVHQSFVPDRSAGLFDVFVDSIGVLLAGGVLWKFYRILPTRLKNWLKE